MARLARVVIEGFPYHIIQRGNRRQNVFFSDKDKERYLKILELQAKLFNLEIWSYCLMDNHVHLIIVPHQRDSLQRGVGETHQLYTKMVNFREGWRGYLWQGRFKSFPMNDKYLFSAVRYVERNPVRAGLVGRAWDYKWSSAQYRVFKRKSSLLSNFYLMDEVKDWKKYLAEEGSQEDVEKIRKSSESGRPLGDNSFIDRLEVLTGRLLQKLKPGPKK